MAWNFQVSPFARLLSSDGADRNAKLSVWAQER